VTDKTVAEIASDESLRALNDQRSRLLNARARAGLLLSAAAVVTSFLGPEALKDVSVRDATEYSVRTLETAEVVAIAAFAATAGLCAVVLLPWPRRYGWYWGVAPREILRRYAGETTEVMTAEAVHRELALEHDEYLENNSAKLRLLHRLLSLAVLLLVIEVIAWITDLA
jgi:hypothetical protein